VPTAGLDKPHSEHTGQTALLSARAQIGFMGPAVFLTQLGRVTTPMGAVACMARPPLPASRMRQAHG
jgi:hypothetical protein